MSCDLEVRCHSCARPFEVVVYPDEHDGDLYTVPAGMRASCPWCGREHTAGLELELVQRKGDSSPLSAVESPMNKVSLNDIEALGAPAFNLCDRYAADSLALGIDMDQQCYDAVFAAHGGASVDTVLGFIELPPAHPARAEIYSALLEVVQNAQNLRASSTT